jgi:alpha-glucosidase
MPLRSRPWWQTGVLYQVYPRSFQDADGDGTGDLDGVTSRLGYLADLGVDAVWISPFYPSPLADGGYDVADYCGVDPVFGDLAAFGRLAEEAHRLGLRLVVDWVPNHSSDRHPWFASSRSSRDSPHRDWYVWRDARPGTGPGTGRPPEPPTNWLSAFGGPAWTWDEPTGQFYLHSFLAEQPDLNWRNADLRAAMLVTLCFWMDRGVDGFRIDTAHYTLKDPLFRDNPPEPYPDAGHKPVSDYDRQRHLHDRAHPDVHELFRTFRAVVDAYPARGSASVGAPPARALFGEMHLGHDLPQWASYFGEAAGDGMRDELHLPINFGLLGTPWTAAGLRAHVEAVEAALPAGAWPTYVLGSHDERRLVARVGGAAGARLAAVLLLTLRGTPTLYAGDEIGTPDVDVPPHRLRDPAGIRTGVPGLGRDSGRTPMAWDASPSAGFSAAPEPDLWLPLHPTHAAVNVETESADAGSILTLYRRLLALRRATPALHSGTYRTLDGAPDTVFAYERRSGDSRAVVLLHLGEGEARVGLPDGDGHVALSTHSREAGASGPEITLGPNEGVVLTAGPG